MAHIHPLLQKTLDSLSSLSQAEWQRGDSNGLIMNAFHEMKARDEIRSSTDRLCWNIEDLVKADAFAPEELQAIQSTLQSIRPVFDRQGLGCESEIDRILSQIEVKLKK